MRSDTLSLGSSHVGRRGLMPLAEPADMHGPTPGKSLLFSECHFPHFEREVTPNDLSILPRI